jgi:hypothetical protein
MVYHSLLPHRVPSLVYFAKTGSAAIVRDHRSIPAAASTLREAATQAKMVAQEAAPDEQAARATQNRP